MTILENESELIALAIDGDRDSLGRLLEAYAPELRRRLQGKISTRWQALLSDDDILQQTFADAFMGIKRFQSTGTQAFLAWLVRISQNNLQDAVKHLQANKSGGQQQQVAAGSDESYHRLMHDIADSISSPSIKAARKEIRHDLQQAIAKLPISYQQIVMDYDIHGESAEVVAERVGCSVGAMYMRRSRAHAMLGKIMDTNV
jgi:RNA polymerase sigma-70 factor, ECF subfamily